MTDLTVSVVAMIVSVAAVAAAGACLRTQHWYARQSFRSSIHLDWEDKPLVVRVTSWLFLAGRGRRL